MPLYVNYTTGELKSQEEIELRDGKRDWRKRKKMSLQVADLMEAYDQEKAAIMKTCGTLLEFSGTPDGKLTLHRANFCRLRLCPMCQWRRSLKLRTQADQIFREVFRQGYQAIFVTLTIKNCGEDELPATVDKLYQGAWNLQRQKSFVKSFVGFYRAFEITYNREENSFHPHFHYLLVTDHEYFRDTKLYWDHDKLMKKWRRLLKLDYDPSVSIEAIHQKEDQTITSACAEVCKYPLKSAEIHDAHVLEVVDRLLHGRRLLSWGGLLREIRARLQLDDVETGDLIHTDEEEPGEDISEDLIAYIWRYGFYIPRDYGKTED